MPQVLPMTRVEAYLAYKAGVIQESDLKPTLKTNFYTGLEHWLAFWCGLCDDYPVDENNDPKWYNEEEYYVAYLCGIAQDYPANCYRRVGAYLRHIISYRWPTPEKPLTREEYYLSLINSTTTSNLTPSSNFNLNDTTDGTFQGVEVYGDTTQNGEPTLDAPVDVNVVTGEQTVTVTGKNLLPFTNQDFTLNNIRFYVENGSLFIDGTSVGEMSPNSSVFKNNFRFVLPAGTYTGSEAFIEAANGLPAYIKKYSDNSTLLTINGRNIPHASFTLTEDTEVFVSFYIYQKIFSHQKVEIQLELGSTPTEYQPYQGQTYPLSLGSLELCKIGNYQDYLWTDGEKWYKHKMVEKDTFTGAENWSTNTGAGRQFYVPLTNFVSYSYVTAYSPTFVMSTNTAPNHFHIGNSGLLVVVQPTSDGSLVADSAAEWKSWLSAHNMVVYRALATPTDEEITDQTLLAQLDALAAGQSYDPLTNFIVTATDPNLPALLKITAYKKQ